MAQIHDALLFSPNRSNMDLSAPVLTTVCPGVLYPLRTIKCVPGDTHRIKISGLCRTEGTLSPVFGSMIQETSVFFVPSRLYVPEMSANDDVTDVDSIRYPTFSPALAVPPGKIMVSLSEAAYPTLPNNSVRAQGLTVQPNSLAAFIGFGPGFTPIHNETADVIPTHYSAIPFLGYYDIFRTYFANRQQSEYYCFGVPENHTSPSPVIGYNLNTLALKDLDEMFRKAKATVYEYAWPYDPSDRGINPTTQTNIPFKNFTTASNTNYGPVFGWDKAGLVLTSYRNDLLTSIYSKEKYNNLLQKVNIQTQTTTAGTSVSVVNVLSMFKQYRALVRTLVSGGSYDSFISAQYGTDVPTSANEPVLLGFTRNLLQFDDVTATAEGANTNIGDQGGKGFGPIESDTFTCSVREHGYIMVMYRLVPLVNYSSGTRSDLRVTTLGQEYLPELDRVGYEPFMLDRLDSRFQGRYLQGDVLSGAFGGIVTGDGALHDPANYSLGYQPAWLEYTSATGRILGDFAGTKRYWTFDRKPWQVQEQLINGAVWDVVPLGSSVSANSYIYPGDYRYIFADSRENAENFNLQFVVQDYVKREKSKAVMPSII
ncbi:major capsid protein [Dipodfec virus RodF1_49]|uniref:Major capsid protein n=1 Tax=Dipodfec virus RodF1_49 TaxID=2929299 RepID=A0A976R8E1_9VIRU|nr:major capsid protein [Dipodfec virus RodF1_49]